MQLQSAVEDPLGEIERPGNEQGFTPDDTNASAGPEHLAGVAHGRERGGVGELPAVNDPVRWWMAARIRGAEGALEIAAVRELDQHGPLHRVRSARLAAEPMAPELVDEGGIARLPAALAAQNVLHGRHARARHSAEPRV